MYSLFNMLQALLNGGMNKISIIKLKTQQSLKNKLIVRKMYIAENEKSKKKPSLIPHSKRTMLLI